MALTKCPRCELNYILDAGDLCTVCREEVRGKRGADDGLSMCSVCGELPALSGEDMCRACLTEMRSIEIVTTSEDEETPVEAAELEPEPVSSLDEIEAVDTLKGKAADEGMELDEELEEELEAELEDDDLPLEPEDLDDAEDEPDAEDEEPGEDDEELDDEDDDDEELDDEDDEA